MKTTKQILLDAADHIERVGLYKGRFYEDSENRQGSRCCVLGALRVCTPHFYADGGAGAYFAYTNAADAVMRRLSGQFLPSWRRYSGCFLSLWNDAPDRTQDEVVATLRACANELGS